MTNAKAPAHRPCENEFEYRGITWNAYTSQTLLHRSEKFEFRPDDIIVATFPRSGTTLTQEIIWQIVNHEIVEKDGKYGSTDKRFPFLEFEADAYIPGSPYPIDILESQTTSRLIKTHLPYFILRDQIEKVNPKMVIVMRNPKDNAVSMYHFHHTIDNFGWKGTWEEFLYMYLIGKTFSGDFFTNNLEWWSLRDRENVLIVRFEDLLRQPVQQVRIIATFLGYQLSAEKVDIIAHNTSFKVMSKNENLNIEDGQFIRKGACGEWKDRFTVAQNEEMDKHINNRLKGTELNFFYE